MLSAAITHGLKGLLSVAGDLGPALLYQTVLDQVYQRGLSACSTRRREMDVLPRSSAQGLGQCHQRQRKGQGNEGQDLAGEAHGCVAPAQEDVVLARRDVHGQ
jgi:hypothetical protein